MSGLNEADTCRINITPALKTTGWCDPYWRGAEQHQPANHKGGTYGGK